MLINRVINIDGGQRSGSGTIVRYAVSLSALLGEELHLTNIRAKRPQPGLRPQHLKAIEAVAEICRGSLEGGEVGSREIRFKCEGEIRGGYYEWDIGTAGSTTMLAMTILPVACFASKPLHVRISGGLFQDFAPSAFHMKFVLFPLLKRMGIEVELNIIRPGYVPKGGGIIEVKINPIKERIKPIQLLEQGKIVSIKGVALSSHLKERKVSERMAEKCCQILKSKGLIADITPIYDTSAIQAGAALAVYAQTDTGCIIGSDRAGEPGRTSEEIGRYVAQTLLEDLSSGATVDRYTADQLILYASLAEGTSEYIVPKMTEHIDTNLWLVESILGAKTEVKGNRVKIKGVAYRRD